MPRNKSLYHASLYDLYKISGFEELNERAASTTAD